MAIVIPSKNIYQKENPKVRDNVIERIEVGAVEVVPDNEYETPVYNGDFYINEEEINKKTNTNKKDFQATVSTSSMGAITGVLFSCVYFENTLGYYDTTIKIKRKKDNQFITELYNGVEEINGEEKEKEILYYSVSGNLTTQNISSTVTYNGNENFNNNAPMGAILYDDKTLTTKDGTLEFPKLPITVTKTNGSIFPNLTSKVVGLSNEEYYQITPYTEEDDYIEIFIHALCYMQNKKMVGIDSTTAIASTKNISISGEYEEYKAEKITITAYGNTIGIDLVDKTIYINGETQKKVHSIDGNELMQTTNYIKDTYGNANSIEKMYGDTQLAYSRGKETATIRCSISDYYEENGEKKISIDKSTGRMSFKIGDKIIPMVYTSGGVDRAMSNYQDGSPKVFEVLGVRKYYDGAVWQELSSQEVAKNEEVSLFVNVNTGELFVSYADTAETAPIKFNIDSNNLVAEISDGVNGTLKLEDGKVILEK